ncbi:membrane bound o-acyl transferase family domain-containing protein [Cordyceps javanica]|uniref:Membrane bound o-acyl transferase family domain-containing protein n=1 Tax=Cordyceps javanica TaxID=43265 RepID=A0A545V524_9HYPO|nr:membrane bound o-acyl transferase family domain-containing protein [Cordyceps javanica]TQW08074.1 membrane bound o-acyl transferase family domain-containing protein [Cordyceps javanica]
MLDFLGTFMMKDPYFVFGREKSLEYALPWYLENLPPWRLEAYRQLFSITGAFSAVAAAYSLADLVHYGVTLYCNPSRNIPWIYTSAVGSLGEVFDRGLAGFWGSWWHQTFRQQFLSPAAFLVKKGIILKGTALGNLVALMSTFAMSGLLHGMGSLSAVPQTKLWKQPAFFLLQPVGIILQQQIAFRLHRSLPTAHVTLRRIGNAWFTLLWLYATAPLFNDDMAEMGLWLLEPVPFSVFRAMGFGYPGDAAWRWDRSYFFRWHSGRSWWQSGFAI